MKNCHTMIYKSTGAVLARIQMDKDLPQGGGVSEVAPDLLRGTSFGSAEDARAFGRKLATAAIASQRREGGDVLSEGAVVVQHLLCLQQAISDTSVMNLNHAAMSRQLAAASSARFSSVSTGREPFENTTACLCMKDAMLAHVECDMLAGCRLAKEGATLVAQVLQREEWFMRGSSPDEKHNFCQRYLPEIKKAYFNLSNAKTTNIKSTLRFIAIGVGKSTSVQFPNERGEPFLPIVDESLLIKGSSNGDDKLHDNPAIRLLANIFAMRAQDGSEGAESERNCMNGAVELGTQLLSYYVRHSRSKTGTGSSWPPKKSGADDAGKVYQWVTDFLGISHEKHCDYLNGLHIGPWSLVYVMHLLNAIFGVYIFDSAVMNNSSGEFNEAR